MVELVANLSPPSTIFPVSARGRLSGYTLLQGSGSRPWGPGYNMSGKAVLAMYDLGRENFEYGWVCCAGEYL